MSTFLPGKALKLDAVSYIYADNADLSELMPFYFRVSFKPADNSTGGYQYVVSYNPTGEVHRFYVRLYTDSTYKQTNLQVLLYTDTGDYVYYNTRIDQAGYNDVVGGNPHLKNAPITVELYWDGTVVTMFINGFSADVQRYSLTGNHPAGGVGILAVGTNSRALGSDNFYGYVDDIVFGVGWPWDDGYDSVSHRFSWCKWGRNVGEDTTDYKHAWSFDAGNGNDEIGDWHLDNSGGYPGYADGILGIWTGDISYIYKEAPLLRGSITTKPLRAKLL